MCGCFRRVKISWLLGKTALRQEHLFGCWLSAESFFGFPTPPPPGGAAPASPRSPLSRGRLSGMALSK
jgi:hypothetical protein